MQKGKKYYLNVSSYKYKREYMKLYQSNIDKVLNTYNNNSPELIIESQNLCPGGKRCKNYLIIMNLEQKIKSLNDTINQLTKIKEFSENNHNIDFTPMKTEENTKKHTFNEICNSFRNSGIKRKLNISTRNMFGNNTLQPQISEPYRLKLDNKLNNVEENNKNGINKKLMNGKKQINLDLNKFKNIGVRLNAEKNGINEEFFMNKNAEKNELKNNNIRNYDEKEKKIQNLINHIFNNKNKELIIYKKIEKSKNKEINIKRAEPKTIKKIKFPKIKVNPYNLLIPNKINKIKNKRYNPDLTEEYNNIEEKDENKLYFRKFKGKLKNSFNESRKKILSKSHGFYNSNDSKSEKYNLFNTNDKFSKTVSEDKKFFLFKQSENIANIIRPLSLNQKPFRLKINISQNEFITDKNSVKDEKNKDNNLVSVNEDNDIFDKFLKLFEIKENEDVNQEYRIYKEICDLSNNKNESLIEKLKSLSDDKLNEYILFIKHSIIFMKDITDIFHILNRLYNINSLEKNDNHKNFDKNNINSEFTKYSTLIKEILKCDSVFIYIYDSNTDSLILKGQKEEKKYPKDKDLIGKCYISGNILNIKKDLNNKERMLIYPIKDLDNTIYGVFEAKDESSDKDNIFNFNKKDEIIMSFISKIFVISFKYNIIKVKLK